MSPAGPTPDPLVAPDVPNVPPSRPHMTAGCQKVIFTTSCISTKLFKYEPDGGKSTLEKQNQASKRHVMKFSKITNSAQTRLFQTRRGEIDPGEAGNDLKTARHEIVHFSKTL